MDEQQALNAPYVVDWNGRVLKFSGVTQGVKAACVSACKLRAIQEHEEIQSLRYRSDDSITKSEKRESNRDFEDKIRSGHYGWSDDGAGDLLSEWRSTPEGVMTFSSALLDAGGTPLTRDELKQFASERREVLQTILQLVLLDASDPKGMRSPVAMMLSDLLKSLLKSQTCMDS